jgi:hypothetical protein
MASTSLKTLGLTKDQRLALLPILNMLAKTDFWHDFHKSYMQELLNNTSLTSSLSFAERGRNIATIRSRLGGDKSLDEYFMEFMDGNILYTEGGKIADHTSEKDLLSSVGVNFGAIESALKGWNQIKETKWNTSADKEMLPALADIKPTFGPFSRNYSVKAVPVKAYEKNSFLPSAFEYQAGNVRNFVLMVDASILSITELGLPGLVEVIDGSYSKDHIYNFYFLQSNENDSDPATKLTEIKNTTENVNIFYLKDEGHTSIYPSFNKKDEDPNINLYSLIGIQSVRAADETITAKLSGNVSQMVEDVGEISKIDKAAQKAVDTLVEEGGVITPNSLLYFLLKRAGDWCQALCLLDKTRSYTLYQQITTPMKKKAGKDTYKYSITEIAKVTLQDIINSHESRKEKIVLALLTLDRVLLAYSLLLGLNVFFTTKYANLQPSKKGRSIHWSIFFNNKDTGMTPEQIEQEKKEIREKALVFLTKQGDISAKNVALQSEVATFEASLKTHRQTIVNTKNISLHEYIVGLYSYFSLEQSYIRTQEIADLNKRLEATFTKLRELTEKNEDADIEAIRNETENGMKLVEKMTSVESINTSLVTQLESQDIQIPNVEKIPAILDKIVESIQTPKNSDFRKEISYNNFLEEVVKGLRQLIQSCVGSGKVAFESLADLVKQDEVTLEFILGEKPAKSASRKQTMLMKYIKDSLLTIFPNVIPRGGFIYNKSMNFEEFLSTIQKLFFQLRSRRILAYNYYKWKQLNDYGSLELNSDLFIGLKQAYVTDRNGNYFSILDNYIVTEEESQYFLLVEAEQNEELNKYLQVLEKDKQYEMGLLMYRYIIMRNRLYNCDRMYTNYLSLYYQFYEELYSFTLENPESAKLIHGDMELQTDVLSVNLQNEIENLLKEASKIRTNMTSDDVFLEFNPSVGEKHFGDKLENIFRLLSDIRLSIFSYSKRHYSPTIELAFTDYEAAYILLTLTGEKKEEIKKELMEDFTAETALKDTLESTLASIEGTTSKKYTSAELDTQSAAELSKKSLTELQAEKKDLKDETLNTMVELLDNKRMLALLEVISTATEAKGGRRQKRKRITRRKKKSKSKRTSRKH